MINYDSLFDQLLNKSLSSEAELKLREEIESNAELKNYFESYQSAYLLANVLERRAIKEKVIAANTAAPKIEKQTGFWSKVLAFLAALILISLLGYFYNSFVKTNQTPQHFAEQHFKAYPDRVTSMGANTIDLTAYNNGDYKQAILDLENVPGFEADFYQAISHLGLQQYATAVDQLKSIESAAPNSYQKSLRWYLALAHLGADNTAEAKTLLLAIQNDTSSDYQKTAAGKILDGME